MKIKRYFAKDVKTAIQMVRDEQGPDAVIMSNNRVDGGVEIIAAIDYDETIFTSKNDAQEKQEKDDNVYEGLAKKDNANIKSHSLKKNPVITESSNSISRYRPDEISDLKSELSSIREMLEGQMASMAWSDLNIKKPVQAQYIKKLVSMGFSEKLSLQLTSKSIQTGDTKTSWRHILADLVDQVPVSTRTVLETGGIVALVGPTGVGKTTTAAKLAATYALKHGKRNVGLITIDNYRVAAYEQLKVYGKIIDIPVRLAESNIELNSILNDFYDKELIIIDTAGLGQYDKHNTEQAAILDQSKFNVKKSLVVSANTQGKAIKDIVRSFSCYAPTDCIVTKMDESPTIGHIIDTLIDNDLPLSFTTDGQQVPEDINIASAHQLITHCVANKNVDKQLPTDLEMAMNYKEACVNASV